MTNLLSDEQLPLYKLFDNIRRLDRQSGHHTVDLPSYFLLLETLRRGYCVNAWEEVYDLCEALWLKPHHRHNPVLNRDILRRHVFVALTIRMAHDVGTAPFAEMLQRALESTGHAPAATPPRQEPALPPPTLRPPEAIRPGAADVAATQETGMFQLFFGTTESRETTDINVVLLQDVQEELMKTPWSLKGGYFPVSPRKMEQQLRALRFTEKQTGRPEIDMEATIGKVARNGHFDTFAWKRAARHRTRWTLLIDTSESMAAFSAFGEEIAGILRQRLPENDGQVLYFNNVITDRLYKGPRQTGFVPWSEFVGKPAKNILIFSDAGAARGFYNEDRVVDTVRMLKKLKPHKTAWLNPMPKRRWEHSSAEMIARFSGMFEIAEDSLDEIPNIIRLFKSKISLSND